jgi:hypothetical protein
LISLTKNSSSDLAQVEELVEAVLDHLAVAHHRLLVEDTSPSYDPPCVHALPSL